MEAHERKEPNMHTEEATGKLLILVLNLKLNENGRVDTTWGDKTPIGLARTIKRIVDGDWPDEPELGINV